MKPLPEAQVSSRAIGKNLWAAELLQDPPPVPRSVWKAPTSIIYLPQCLCGDQGHTREVTGESPGVTVGDTGEAGAVGHQCRGVTKGPQPQHPSRHCTRVPNIPAGWHPCRRLGQP